MPPKKPKSNLREWREKHFAELEKNLETWKSIRDDTQASDKDRTEAAKNIQRALDGLTPERGTKLSGGPTQGTTPTETTTPEEDKLIDDILGKKNETTIG